MFPLAVFCVFVRGRDLLGTRPYFPTHCYINEARSHHSLPLKSHTAANLPPPHVSFFYFAVDSADCLVSWSRRKQQGKKSFLERKKENRSERRRFEVQMHIFVLHQSFQAKFELRRLQMLCKLTSRVTGASENHIQRVSTAEQLPVFTAIHTEMSLIRQVNIPFVILVCCLCL